MTMFDRLFYNGMRFERPLDVVICIDIFDVRYMTLDLAGRPVVVSKRAPEKSARTIRSTTSQEASWSAN